ncbi:MAG TPA: zinc ribbon domain-containing protein [Nitrosopumilus sp.]|nr:zinc ribbon domain-containing protein [Nitrosopumilus sp.]
MKSLLDQVNILIKMKVGDAYRLEHIKLMLKQKRTIFGSDRVYLDHLIYEYVEQIKTQKQLSKIRGEDPFEENSDDISSEEKNEFEEDQNDDDKFEDKIIEPEHIYCWKCGTNIPEISKFCHKCGANIEHPKEETLDKKEKKKEKKKPKEKGEGMSTSKKILITLVVLFVIGVMISLVMIGAFVSVVSDISDGTTEKRKLSKTIILNESQSAGTLVVNIEKIEFNNKYAKIFLTAENIGSESHTVYSGYVIQGTKDFQNIMFQPFGATGEKFDGRNIPPGITREGIMFVDVWNPNNEFEIILDVYVGDVVVQPDEFKFNVNPEQTVDSKCGQGTIFDMNTNSCIIP